MKTKNIISRVLDGLIIAMFVLFLSSAGFQDRLIQGWYQQWLPDLNGSTIKDITFLDSLTGFAVTTTNSSVQAYILKTTNGGDNWNIVHTYVPPSTNSGFIRIQFTNNNIGYSSTNYFDLFKTTNGGINWINYSSQPTGAEDFCAINTDTLFYVYSGSFGGGVYRTTNGGINWTRIWTNGSSGNPDKIYMYDKNLGFACTESIYSTIFYRTTNGGYNWSNLNDSTFTGIQFLDTLTGWKQTVSGVKKTTDGGLTWVRQTTPVFFDERYLDLTLINKDTIWYVGPALLRYNRGWGVICQTTNGGINWGYQLPDTSIKITNYYHINFINKYNGWAYRNTTTGVHTKYGGNDTTYYTGLRLVPEVVPVKFYLGQNYPNPFNPATNIPFELKEPSHITLKVYDLQGREIKELVNGRWGTGRFIADFEGSGISSGIYFYKIVIYGETTKQTYTDTRKMLMIK